MNNFKLLWKHINIRRRKQLLVFVCLMLLASFLEILSVGSVLPFIGALTNPEEVFQSNYLQPIISLLGITSSKQILMPLTAIFISASIFTGIIRIALLYVSNRLAQAMGADLSLEIYQRTLHQDYSVHISRNSSEIVTSIITKTNLVCDGILLPIMNLISSSFIIVALMSVLFIIDTLVALILATSIGGLYLLVMIYSRSQIQENSRIISTLSTKKVKSLQEGLGSMRDILLSQAQNFYFKIYRDADLPVRRAFATLAFIGGSPKYAIEALGMTIVALLAYSMSNQDLSSSSSIAVLAAFAIGAQRILPTFQLSYASYSLIKGSNESFKDVLQLLEQPLPKVSNQGSNHDIIFEDKIELRNVSFRYSDNAPWIFQNVNLEIKNGEHVGFVGPTGTGKSTLIDILLGLLLPSEGGLFIDGIQIDETNRGSWQKKIAHVPQMIVLSDNSVEENIAFATDKSEINIKRVSKAAKEAQLSELIESWPEKYQTLIGENGIKISGGQRQRIGIARALYNESQVLFFDEATSALDNKTEKNFMKSLGELSNNLTLLMIAHRLTTLEHCNKIIELNNSKNLTETQYNVLVK